ncbi:hypothetical protein [Aeromonas salmonicida]|nr:hypothetical protein [Aeromonas salmonicida]UUI60008.1 hypothetical protein NP805_17880 [Aeromonas salmonicida]
MNKDQLKGRSEESKGKSDKESTGAAQKSTGKDRVAAEDRKDAKKGK